MKQAARIQSAIDILERISASTIPMDNTIRDFMQYKRYIGSKDRREIVELVYDIVRATARLGWWLKRMKIEDTPRARVIAYLALSNYPVQDLSQQLPSLFSGEKHCPEKLDEIEQKLLSDLDIHDLNHDEMPVEIRVECPDWAAPTLQKLYSTDFEAQLSEMLEPARLDLRVNTIKGTRERAQEWLAADNVETVPTPYSLWGLRTTGKPFMSATKAFHKGMVEIQDEGSQLIAYLCGAKPGMRVLDYCAGSGGKTLGIAASMEGKGLIVAMDNNSKRLEKGRRRYRKANVHNIEVRSLEDEKNRKWLRRQKGTMDIVLVDVPCSSSGTWRRNPDLRWNWYGPSLEEIKEMQRDILERVSDKVKVGGRLVYATCSLLPEENEEQIELFLKNHPEYNVVPVPDIWPEGEKKCPVQEKYLRLTPKEHQTDGFFTAILQRV
ncbi:MAG: RsmB/NOP family class I SAM-dependent RNA methyltransferase [Alphaproteobacteria bacterium]|nr:RsmB/NOP family class I SAM-dependent RNA methyltransferase [Alphaproteobacteria bacterium]